MPKIGGSGSSLAPAFVLTCVWSIFLGYGPEVNSWSAHGDLLDIKPARHVVWND